MEKSSAEWLLCIVCSFFPPPLCSQWLSYAERLCIFFLVGNSFLRVVGWLDRCMSWMGRINWFFYVLLHWYPWPHPISLSLFPFLIFCLFSVLKHVSMDPAFHILRTAFPYARDSHPLDHTFVQNSDRWLIRGHKRQMPVVCSLSGFRTFKHAPLSGHEGGRGHDGQTCLLSFLWGMSPLCNNNHTTTQPIQSIHP